MALDEQGIGIARSVLRFIGKHFGNLFKLTANDIQNVVDAKANSGKLSVKRMLKNNYEKEYTPKMNEELTKSLCKELKKYHLAYAVEPIKDEKTNEILEYKIMYNKKDALIISKAIGDTEEKMLNNKNQPKKSLDDMLKRNRKILQKEGLNRTEPVKHKEVGAR